MSDSNYQVAGKMVDIIKQVVRDELDSRDRVFVGTIHQKNAKSDSYSVYIETGKAPTPKNIMASIPNESKHEYSPGDHVYVLAVGGQISQAFIVGAAGVGGDSVRGEISRVSDKLDILNENILKTGILAPAFHMEPFSYEYQEAPGAQPTYRLGLKVYWSGRFLFLHSLLISFSYSNSQQSDSVTAVIGWASAPGSVPPARLSVISSSNTSIIPLGEGPILSANIQYPNIDQYFTILTSLEYDETLLIDRILDPRASFGVVLLARTTAIVKP